MAIRFTKSLLITNGKIYYEGFCDSEDAKPAQNVSEGSTLTESDTGDVYMYNEQGGWAKMFSIKGT